MKTKRARADCGCEGDPDYFVVSTEGGKKRTAAKGCDHDDTRPDWEASCENCGESPVVRCTGLCGPCTFGESETYGGNW